MQQAGVKHSAVQETTSQRLDSVKVVSRTTDSIQSSQKTAMATQGGKSSQEGPRDSIWNVDHGSVSERIGARRERIRKRIEAAKRLTRLMKIQKMMGFRGEDEEEAFVKLATDSGNIEIHGMTNSGQELVSNVRLAGEFLQVIQVSNAMTTFISTCQVEHRNVRDDKNRSIKRILEKEEQDMEDKFAAIGLIC